jgi:hypothetical protein
MNKIHIFFRRFPALRHIFYKNRTVVGNVKKFDPNFIMAIERSILE